MAGTHSRLSPSGAHGYLRCPGKPNAEAGLEDRATRFAAQGTVFHDVAEICLALDLEPAFFAGRVLEADGFEVEVDADMVRHMQKGLDRARELLEGCTYFVETRVDLSDVLGVSGEGGTLDLGIIDIENRELTIWDWKYGAGIPVDPVDNEQLRIYALGFWNMIAWKFFGNPDGVTVRIHIEQPRVAGGGGEWLTTMQELLDWIPELQAGAAATLDPDAPRVAGQKQCRMCRARKGKCDVYDAYNFELAGMDYDELDAAVEMGVGIPMTPVEALTPERRAWIVLNAGMVRRWLDDLHAQVLDAALRGEPTPGVKPIAGREGKRAYLPKHEAEVEAALRKAGLKGDDVFEKKLISPTQAEKKIGKSGYAQLSKFVRRSAAKPVLVSENHKAERLKSWDEEFDDDDVILESDDG